MEGLEQSVTAGTLIWGHGATILSSQGQSEYLLPHSALTKRAILFLVPIKFGGRFLLIKVFK